MDTPPPSDPDLQRHLAAVRAHPDDIAGYRAFAEALLRLPDPVDRLPWCEAALAVAPQAEAGYLGFSELWARARMGVGRRDPAVPRQGIGLLQRALAAARPGALRTHIHADLAFLYNEIGRHDLAERHGRLAQGCPNALYHLWLTEALFAQNRFERDPLCGIDLSPLATPVLQRLADEVAERRARAPVAPSGRTLVLVSVDAVYFKRFALAQILSAHHFGVDWDFHFHLINPDAECHAVIAQARRLAPGMSLTFTAETWQPVGPGSDRVYYAGSRLLMADRLARETGSDIVIADADILFRSDPRALLAETEGYDVTTVEFPGEPLCNRYSASFFVVRQGFMGELYLTAVAHFLRENFKRHLIWTMDQVALYGVERRLTDMTGGALRVKIWPALVMSVDHQPDAPIWPGGNMAKWEDSPYLRLRDEVLHAYGVPPPGAPAAPAAPAPVVPPAFTICKLGQVFDEIAECLRHGLEQLGHRTEVIQAGLVQGSRTIILGAQQIADWSKIPADSIIFNLEQLGVSSVYITDEYMAQLARHTVWDYSPRNIDWLRERGVNASAQLVRLGHAPALVRIPPAADPDIDVLFYGAVNERRLRVLQAIQAAGLNLVVRTNLFGEERDAVVARSKVVLNLHYYDTKIFEIARVGYLLANGKAVVTEGGPDTELEPELRDALVAAPYEGLAEACRALVADDGRRRALEARAAAVFTARSQADYLRGAVADALAVPVR